MLAESDDALLCVAFARVRGVHLIAREVAEVARRGAGAGAGDQLAIFAGVATMFAMFGTTSEVEIGTIRRWARAFGC